MKRLMLVVVALFVFAGFNAFAGDGDMIINGKLGVGTNLPAEKLHVYGGALTFIKVDASGDAGANAQAYFKSKSKGYYYSGLIMESDSGVAGSIAGSNASGTNNAYVDLMVGGDTNEYTKVRILENGNVGVGTSSPTHKLEVSGDIFASGVTTNSSGLPFYAYNETV